MKEYIIKTTLLIIIGIMVTVIFPLLSIVLGIILLVGAPIIALVAERDGLQLNIHI